MKMKKRNSKYWQDRFINVENRANALGLDAYTKVEPAFNEVQKALNNEIERWYYRVAKNNEVSILEAKRMLSKSELKEFKWTLQDYIKYGNENALNGKWIKQLENASAKFHITRLEALKIKTQHQLEIAFGNELDVIDNMASKVITDTYYHSCYEISKGLGIGFDIASIDERKLNLLKNKPWATDGKNFSSRLWTNKNKMISELHKELTKNCLLGKAPDEAIKNMTNFVNKKMKNAKSHAGRLVMTEQAYFSSQAQQEVFNDLDVEEFEVVATLDTHTSEVCRMMDTRHFKMSDYEVGTTAPPFHPWCRSCTCPYFDDEFTVNETRVARDEFGNEYKVPGNMKYDDWYEKFVNDSNSSILNSNTKPVIIKSVKEIDKQYSKINGEHAYTEDLKNTNPKYKSSVDKKDKLYTHNCQRCVNAYEMRRRGYDVAAAPRVLDGTDTLPIMTHDRGWANVYEKGRDSLVECFSNSKKNVKKKVIDKLLDWGDGARAIVRVRWTKGGGHVFIAENQADKIVFIDPQTNNVDASLYFNHCKVDGTYLLRIDDKDFTDLIDECCE